MTASFPGLQELTEAWGFFLFFFYLHNRAVWCVTRRVLGLHSGPCSRGRVAGSLAGCRTGRQGETQAGWGLRSLGDWSRRFAGRYILCLCALLLSNRNGRKRMQLCGRAQFRNYIWLAFRASFGLGVVCERLFDRWATKRSVCCVLSAVGQLRSAVLGFRSFCRGFLGGEKAICRSADELSRRGGTLNRGLCQSKGLPGDSSRWQVAGAGGGLRQHSGTQTTWSPQWTYRKVWYMITPNLLDREVKQTLTYKKPSVWC